MTVKELEQIYADEVARLEDMKQRGDLTEDWGECSLICARNTLKQIRSITNG